MRSVDVEEVLSVECSICGAKRNRKCVKITNPRKGGVTDFHPQRKEKVLQIERDSHKFLSTIPLEEIKSNTIIKSHETGFLGKIVFIKRDKLLFLIRWYDGTESKVSHSDETLMAWPEGYL